MQFQAKVMVMRSWEKRNDDPARQKYNGQAFALAVLVGGRVENQTLTIAFDDENLAKLSSHVGTEEFITIQGTMRAWDGNLMMDKITHVGEAEGGRKRAAA